MNLLEEGVWKLAISHKTMSRAKDNGEKDKQESEEATAADTARKGRRRPRRSRGGRLHKKKATEENPDDEREDIGPIKSEYAAPITSDVKMHAPRTNSSVETDVADIKNGVTSDFTQKPKHVEIATSPQPTQLTAIVDTNESDTKDKVDSNPWAEPGNVGLYRSRWAIQANSDAKSNESNPKDEITTKELGESRGEARNVRGRSNHEYGRLQEQDKRRGPKPWTAEETEYLIQMIGKHGPYWQLIKNIDLEGANILKSRTDGFSLKAKAHGLKRDYKWYVFAFIA